MGFGDTIQKFNQGTSDVTAGTAGIFQAIGKFNQAKSNARAMAKEASLVATNRAREIESLAATQRVSFLNSGLEMEGTPAAIIAETHQIGYADVAAINSSYKKQIKNLMTQARSGLLAGLLGSSAQIGRGAGYIVSGIMDIKTGGAGSIGSAGGV